MALAGAGAPARIGWVAGLAWQVEDFADRRSANDWAAAFLRSNRNHGFTGGGAFVVRLLHCIRQ